MARYVVATSAGRCSPLVCRKVHLCGPVRALSRESAMFTPQAIGTARPPKAGCQALAESPGTAKVERGRPWRGHHYVVVARDEGCKWPRSASIGGGGVCCIFPGLTGPHA